MTVGRGVSFSFRARIIVVLTLLLLLTLATLQYYNNRAQQAVQRELDAQKASVKQTIDRQFEDVGAAISFATFSLSNNKYMYEVLAANPSTLDRQHIRHILTVGEDGIVSDSTEADMVKKVVPVPQTNGQQYVGVAERGVDPVDRFESERGASDTYWLRVKTQTPTEPRKIEYWWIAVVVSTEQVSNVLLDSQQRLADVVISTSADRLRATVGVFVLAVLLMIALVWRFTLPVRQLSDAAVRVAHGDLNFNVGIRRRDEIGQLARTFDQMILGLRAKAELEDRLNNAERAAVIGRLTAAVAHEIRNPLNFINLSIDHVRSKYPPEAEKDRERFERLLTSIKEETARLNRLVTDVLNFGRPANLNARDVDMREVLDQTVGMVRAQAQQQDVEVEVEVPESAVRARVDVEKLKSCFSNILFNAVQAMPTGGRLSVRLESSSDGCVTTISDTGVGIPGDALDRIFEPYYSTKDTGTGLGLAVTKKIIDEHGGRIRVSSTPGVGTTFEVELPSGGPGAVDREPVRTEVGAGS